MRYFFSQRLILLALLLSLGIGAMVARTVWTMRQDEWSFAARTNSNLVTALAHGRNVGVEGDDGARHRRRDAHTGWLYGIVGACRAQGLQVFLASSAHFLSVSSY